MKTKSLTLIEAHASGRKYRRAIWRLAPDYMRFDDDDWGIGLIDAVATDYELEPQAKLLTREDVSMVIYTALRGTVGSVNLDHYLTQNVIDRLFGPEEDV